MPTIELKAGDLIFDKNRSTNVAIHKSIDSSHTLVVEYLVNTELTLIV